MAKQRGAVRFFRIGLEADPTDVSATAYGTPALGYDDPLVTGANKDMRFFQVADGNFSMGVTPNVTEQDVLRGQVGVHHRELTGRSVAGDIGVLAHPETVKYFLDAANGRDSTQELAPHTIQEFYPGIDDTAAPNDEVGTSYVGAKVNQLTVAFGSDQENVLLTTSWIAQREVPYMDSGELPDVADHTKPKNGYIFSSSGLVDVSVASSPVALPLCDYSSVNFTLANNLGLGPACFNADETLRGAISDLIAGQERLSGSFTMQWKDIGIMTHYRNFSNMRMRSMFIHPTSDNSLTFTAIQAASTTAVTIAVSGDPTTILPVGSVIAIQHGGATPTNWSVAKVTASTTGPNTIEVESLDVAVASGDIIWSEALEFNLKTFNMTGLTKQGGPNDSIITLTGTFEGKSDTTGRQFSYKAKGTGLPRS